MQPANQNMQNIVINTGGGGAKTLNPACPIIIFVVGWFFGPVWWGACCMLCEPRYGPAGKIFNIISTILGLIGPISIGIGIMAATIWVADTVNNYASATAAIVDAATNY